MKLFFAMMLMTSNSFAAGCYLFQLKGLVENKDSFRIRIHSGTNSESFFVFPERLDLRLAIYQDKTIQGKFILKTREPVSGSEIVGVESTELAVPDPLHHHQEIRFLKNVKCPPEKK